MSVPPLADFRQASSPTSCRSDCRSDRPRTVRRRQEVAVGPQRDRRVGVAQPSGDDAQRTPASKASVAEVVRRMLGNPVAATVRLNWAVGTVPNGRA